MIIKREIKLKTVSVIICTILLLTLSTGCRFHKMQVDRVRAAIPAAAEFIENNSGFLYFLLDYQDRIRDFNENVSQSNFIAIEKYIISYYQERLLVTRTRTGSAAGHPVLDGSEYDLLTQEEKTVIGSVLLNMETKNFQPSIIISPERIMVAFTRYERASLYIVSPAVEFERRYGDTYERYEYAEKVNDVWGVHLYKMDYN